MTLWDLKRCIGRQLVLISDSFPLPGALEGPRRDLDIVSLLTSTQRSTTSSNSHVQEGGCNR